MLTFRLFSDERKSRSIHVDPLAVISVEETERRPSDAFYQPVAIITLVNGDKHIVYDYSRNVAQKIESARVESLRGTSGGSSDPLPTNGQ